jgi:SP family xylose:H+ symportor-like MFS transporter
MGISPWWPGFQFQANAVGTGPLIAAVAYIAGFALSWGPVTWVLLSEMFPNAIKGKAMAIAVAAQWIANLFVSWSFKILIGNSALNAMFNHGFPYWMYGAMSFLAAAFVYFYVPETKRVRSRKSRTCGRKGRAVAASRVKQPVVG